MSGTEQKSPTGGLRIKLIRSHRAVALYGIGALLIALAVIVGLRSNTIRLANLRGPTAQASARALGGVYRSQAALRSWMVLGEPASEEARRYAWEEEIAPSVDELQGLERHWDKVNRDSLVLAVSALGKLKDVQLRIEEVSLSVDNEPARALLRNEIEPLIATAYSVLTQVIDLERERPENGKAALAAMSDFRNSLRAAHTAIVSFVTTHKDTSDLPAVPVLDEVNERFEAMSAFVDAATPEQRDMLLLLEGKLDTLGGLAREAMEIRRSEEWNVAQHLLATEAVPAADGTISLLGEMSDSQAKLMSDDARLLTTLSTIAMMVALALVVVLAIVARVIARRNSARILEPIAALSGATRALAAGESVDDIPVKGDDELAELTRSFNAMQESLRKSQLELDLERRLVRAMMENLPDNIYFKDNESRFLAISGAFADRVGLEDRTDAVGKTDYDFFDADHAKQAFADEQELMETGNPVIGKEEREVWPDGQVKWASTTKMCLYDGDGATVGTFGISRDITDQKRSQEALHEAKQAAEEANRAKSDFLANMSHEIRTPMNGIIGMTEVLLNTHLSSEQQQYATLTKNSADALLEILNDILDFSKIEAGKLELDVHEFTLRDSIGDTLQTLAVRASEKGLELAYHIPPRIPETLKGDLGRLRQIITNLVGNAIKFTERGEIVVQVKMEATTDTEVCLRFAVSDDGIGIPEARQKAIFDSFSQADTSTTRRYGGTGLGLTISRQLAQLMQGKMWLESESGKGSTFFFTAVFGTVPHAAPPSAPTDHELLSLPVLVVDDNDTNRFILNEMLESWGMHPQTVESGAKALSLLKNAADDEKPFKLVIVDFMMPDMDGLELASRIKMGDTGTIPKVIMLSSAGYPPNSSRLSESEIVRCLTKPAKQSAILDAIEIALRSDSDDESFSIHGPRDGADAPIRSMVPARNLSVLLADDGRVNQLVAINFLEGFGHSVDIANNGREAVDAYLAGAYDAVLMDIQMPEMNGYEATAAIRKKESEVAGDGHIPIIAMTANAMKGDREKCLAAGMDAYIAKPIRRGELFRVIEDAVGEAIPESSQQSIPSLVADTVGESTVGESSGESVFDEVLFRESSGTEDLMQELILIYREDSPQMLERIECALTAGDAGKLHEAAHALKGLVGNFFADPVFNVVAEFDSAARAGELERAQASFTELSDSVRRLGSDLDAFSEKLRS